MAFETVQLGDQHSSDWRMSIAELNSTRAMKPVDILNVITDFEVYEHIDKPYVTGKLVITDTQRLYERFDFQGAETFTVEIQRTRNEEIPPIKKVFIVDEVLQTGRANETSQAIVLHLIEDIGFTDVLINVNKSYKGQPQEIIEKIANEYLQRDVTNNSEDNVDNTMKVLVPNLSPMESLVWIKNRATTKEGYPFFLFSPFATDRFYFIDLGSMLSQKVLNPNDAYTYSNATGTTDNSNRLFTIHDYKLNRVENMARIINAGYLAANHSFYDVTTAKYSTVDFNIHNDVYKKGVQFNKRQKLPIISNNFEHKDKSLTEYSARNIWQAFASKGHEDVKAVEEEDREGFHRRRVVANAFRHLLTKSPIEITVDGRQFLNGRSNFTIGNNIKCVFRETADAGPTVRVDKKLSGDYLIYSARHVFSAEKCFSNLLLTKIANYNDDSYPVG